MFKSISKWYGPIMLCILAYVVISLIALMPARNSLDAYTGLVWNALSTGAGKITALQDQASAATGAVKEVMNNLAASRNDILAAQQTGNMEAALKAYGRATVELNSITESYPDFLNLNPIFATLMDETSGQFNRVSYAREELIKAQASYNNTCMIFFVICPALGGKQNILGADSNPSAPMSITPMGK